MKFCIQASNPRFVSNIVGTSGLSLSEAIEDTFILNTEDAFMCWNHIYVPLSYKYDISYMIGDIIILLKALQTTECGSLVIHWLPDTFRCDWFANWENGEIRIDSFWQCTAGHLERLLNDCNCICITVEMFLNEWKELIKVLLNGLNNNCYSESSDCEMKELIRIYESIEGDGVLYSK